VLARADAGRGVLDAGAGPGDIERNMEL